MSAYTLGDVARICGVSRRRVRYWERTALLDPSHPDPQQTAFGFREGLREYGFRDLVTVRSIVGLLERGIPLRRIRRSADALRERYPDLEPVSALRPWEDSPRVVLHYDGAWMEPDGQLVLDFVRDAAPAGVEPLAGRRDDERRLRAAREWFERGCELDVDPGGFADAIDAYRRAIELDPGHADAHCNLGSVFFNQGRREQARLCFERAVELQPFHVEAHLNLGTYWEDAAADERALGHYRQALESDPLFPDVHVSMALVYEKLALRRTARAHWRRYLQLDPSGSWAGVARKRLEA